MLVVYGGRWPVAGLLDTPASLPAVVGLYYPA